MASSALPIEKAAPLRFRLSPEAVRIITVIAISLFILVPLLLGGMPSSRDLSNHFRFALPFYDAFRSGHYHPGWLAESTGGYGDTSFRFYPPAVYYLLTLARMLTGDWYRATVLTLGVISGIGGLGVYFWAREIFPGPSSIWAAVAYLIAPYHLNQLFQSFLLAEFAGAAVLPFAFMFVERVCSDRRRRDVAGLAASYALLICTHLPLAVIGSLALLVYALVRIGHERRWATIGHLVIAVGLGLAASATYWTTMVAELNWIRADNIQRDASVDYRDNFILSTFSPNHLNVWWMNILLLATAAIFWPTLLLLWRAGKQRGPTEGIAAGSSRIKAIGAVLLLSVFMATPLSRPLWAAVHALQETQFPWRWLAITSLTCAVLILPVIAVWRTLWHGQNRSLALIALAPALFAIAFSFAHVVREAAWISPAQFTAQIDQVRGTQSVSQWWPVWVHEPIGEMNSAVMAAGREVTIYSWQPEKRVFQIAAGAPVEARIRTFYYPHWVATVGAQSLAIKPDVDGALLLSLPAEAMTVTLEFREPLRARLAVAITGFGWILIAGLFFIPIGAGLSFANLGRRRFAAPDGR